MAKILDFGLAKLSGRSLLTKTGTTLGTAAYMSPEQAVGESLDGRTDIWSLGVMLYEMLTGHRPFESDYDQALVYSILNDDPKPMRSIRPEIPEALEKIVRRTMGKKPEDRYQNAAELEADLEAFRVGSGLARKTQKLSGRKGRKVVLAALGVLIIVGAGVLLTLPDVDPKMSSMAILPFVNVAKDPEVEYLCDGLAEALTDQIARLPQLEKVTAFNGALYYKGKDIPPPEIGKQLGVETLLMTRLQGQGDSVVLTMELVNARENTHLWSGRFQEGKSRLNRVVPSVFLSLATELNLSTSPSQSEVASEVSEAYQLYLKSRYSYYKGTVDGYRQSMQYCREAISLDPSFALAYSGLVEGYVQLSSTDFAWGHVRDSAAIAARKAIELDNSLPKPSVLLDLWNGSI